MAAPLTLLSGTRTLLGTDGGQGQLPQATANAQPTVDKVQSRRS